MNKTWQQKKLQFYNFFDISIDTKQKIVYIILIRQEREPARSKIMTTYETLLNAYECSTMNNNLFEKAVKSLSTSSYKDGANITYNFADGSSLDCDSLNPFDLNYATFVSADLSLVSELKKIA